MITRARAGRPSSEKGLVRPIRRQALTKSTTSPCAKLGRIHVTLDAELQHVRAASGSGVCGLGHGQGGRGGGGGMT
jgi:hypothetical protein